MAFPKLTRSSAYGTFVNILKADPILKREVKTLRAYTGDPADISDIASTGNAPWLKVTPHPDKMSFETNLAHHAHFLVDIEMGLEGTNAGTIMDFWESIERAFYPVDPTQYATVQASLFAANIRGIEFLKAGWDVNDKGGLPLTGKGQIKIYFWVTTKGHS